MVVMWVVTRDRDYELLGGQGLIPSRVGVGMTGEEVRKTMDDVAFPQRTVFVKEGLKPEDVPPPTVRFRLLDGDANIYYEGVAAEDLATSSDDIWSILKWGEAEAGCTTLQLLEEGTWRTV
jgi:hypothetical protein